LYISKSSKPFASFIAESECDVAAGQRLLFTETNHSRKETGYLMVRQFVMLP